MSKVEVPAAPRTIGQILGELPPAGWPQTIRKLDVLRRYVAMDQPTLGDARTAAARLGVRERGFYRLVRVYEERGSPKDVRAKRGAPRRTDPRVDAHIRRAAADLGPDATAAAILKEVSRRCAADGLPTPSASMLMTRLDDQPARPDVRGTLGTDADLVLDVAPLPIPLQAEDSLTPFAQLGAIIDADAGQVLSWRLATPPFSDADVGMLVEALPSPPEPSSLRRSVGCPRLSLERRVRFLAKGIAVLEDDHVIRVGAALRAVFGRHLGRIRILEVAPPPGRSIEEGVPIGVARDVIEFLIHRRNAETGDPAAVIR